MATSSFVNVSEEVISAIEENSTYLQTELNKPAKSACLCWYIRLVVCVAKAKTVSCNEFSPQFVQDCRCWRAGIQIGRSKSKPRTSQTGVFILKIFPLSYFLNWTVWTSCWELFGGLETSRTCVDGTGDVFFWQALLDFWEYSCLGISSGWRR